MIKRQYNKIKDRIAQLRFRLLLIATLLVLVLPAFTGSGRLSELLFIGSMTFLFIQSMVAANIKKSRRNILRIFVIVTIIIIWLKPAGIDNPIINVASLLLIAFFFIWVVIFLFRFVRKSEAVNMSVLITSINIYLLAGLIAASLAFMLYLVFPNSYNFPDYIVKPAYVHFIYYCFITMSTVGYGDITPRIPETQTLAYLMAISGQLYVAIIIAFLVGKLLVHSDQNSSNNKS